MIRRIAFVIVGLVLPFTFAACEGESAVCPEGMTYSTQYEYTYGYNPINGKFEPHWGMVSKCRYV